MRQSTLSAAALLLAKAAQAFLPHKMGIAKEPLEHLRALLASSGGVSNGTFEQLIDHDDPERGTFTQHYFYNADYYHGPGSPVLLFNPGEGPLEGFEGFTTNLSIIGTLAQRTGAAVIAIEHRYYGDSSPFDVLDGDALSYLTLDNSIRDMTHFARTAVLPFDRNRTSTPAKAPWVLSGCSYSGALSAWTSQLDPGTFWAYHASSAVVEAITDLWQYGEVVGQAMPPNCSADFSKMIDVIDSVLLGHNESAKHELKTKFGMAELEYDDDFAGSLFVPLGSWQGNSFAGGYNNFSQMCDYVENQWPGSKEPEPSAAGVGATKALNGYAKWVSEVFLAEACHISDDWSGPFSVDCFNSHNASAKFYTDLSPANPANRQWMWFLCNEPFEWWQDRGRGTHVSRLVTRKWYAQQCELYFPGADYGLKNGLSAEDVNAETGGWWGSYEFGPRVAWTVGELDPWRPATPMSVSRPGGPLTSTPEHTVQIVPRGAHCGDLSMRDYEVNAGVKAVMDANLKTLEGWIDEFYEEKGRTRPGSPS